MSEKQVVESYVEIPIADQVMNAINFMNAGLQHPTVVANLGRLLRPTNVRVMLKQGTEPYVHLLSDTTSVNSVQCFYTVEAPGDITPSWFRLMTRRGSWVFLVEWDDERQFTIILDPDN